MGIKLILNASLSLENHSGGLWEWNLLNTDMRNVQREAIKKYQRWYNSTYQLVKEYMPEKEREFVERYETDGMFKYGVFDYLQLRSGTERADKNKLIKYFLDSFQTQLSILLSLYDVAEIKELRLRQIIVADVARTEIEQAEILLTTDFKRAAGSIAGVALELHLKTLCDVNDLPYPPKATMQTFIQALQKAGKLDITEVKRIEYLASIRNQCSHPKDVSEDEIKVLIDGVKKLI